MKKYLLILFCAFFSCVSWSSEIYTLDPEHTYILWQVNHLGFSAQAGKWYATGTLILDEKKPENSKVTARFQMAEMITGLRDLDEHLKDKLFFDVEQFPTATFESKSIKLTDKRSAKINGILTLKGISKPIVLDVVLNKLGKNPITEKSTVGFSGQTHLKRSDFGMIAFLPKVGDEVSIQIEAEAYR